MAKPIKFNAELSGVSTRSDGSLSLRIGTPELTNEEALVLFRLRGIALDCTLTPLNQELEAPEEVKSEIAIKTPSQRLRSVLFAVFAHEKELGKIGKDEIYDVWYPKQMEKLIDFCKKRLPEQ
jgi:hypothetical protein